MTELQRVLNTPDSELGLPLKTYNPETDPVSITIREINERNEARPVLRGGIVRLRRVTGYISSLNRFNDGKRAEEAARLKHIGADSTGRPDDYMASNV